MKNKKVVCCWGTFDLLHEGHKKFLEDARRQGTYLYVVVVPDKAVYQNKDRVPEQKQSDRANALLQTELVDQVFQPELNQSFALVLSIRPDVFVFGHDQQTEWEANLQKHLVKNNLIIEYYTSKIFANGISTTTLLKNQKELITK